jgi:ketosteroid isomerase-like protein
MKTLIKISLLAVAAFALAACQPAANTNTNTNTNTNMAPKAAAPTADSLLALDNKAFEAWKKKDGKFFEGFLADTFVGFGDDGKRPTRAEVMKIISEHKCELKTFALSEPHVTPASADVAILTYKATADGTCEGQKIPSPVTVATVFVRSGDTWKAAYHNEVAVVTPPAASSEKKDPPAATLEKDDDAGMEKKEAPAAPAAANTSTASNSNSNSAAPASGDALTDAIMAVEKKGWEAWMKQDATGLQETTHKDLTFVDPMGKATMGQANVIKVWTDGTCKVSSVDVSDGKATQIANNVAILTFKGTAVGTCGGAKIEPLWGTTVAVKEGDKWKAVYIFETPMRKS